jgi:hypothetical protein
LNVRFVVPRGKSKAELAELLTTRNSAIPVIAFGQAAQTR